MMFGAILGHWYGLRGAYEEGSPERFGKWGALEVFWGPLAFLMSKTGPRIFSIAKTASGQFCRNPLATVKNQSKMCVFDDF